VPTRVEPAQPSAAELAAQVQALTKQADAALDHGEYDAAIAAYRRALQVDTTNQEARRGIGRAQKAKAAEEATEKPPATAPAMAQAESGLVLQVAANERAFVAVHVDGKTALQQVLNPGEIHTLKAKESFDVTTGNAQGIVLTLNGETLKPLGRRGEVKSVHLTANDLKKTSP
jgi:tetratricopeptide (TPR) repeat protein